MTTVEEIINDLNVLRDDLIVKGEVHEDGPMVRDDVDRYKIDRDIGDIIDKIDSIREELDTTPIPTVGNIIALINSTGEQFSNAVDNHADHVGLEHVEGCNDRQEAYATGCRETKDVALKFINGMLEPLAPQPKGFIISKSPHPPPLDDLLDMVNQAGAGISDFVPLSPQYNAYLISMDEAEYNDYNRLATKLFEVAPSRVLNDKYFSDSKRAYFLVTGFPNKGPVWNIIKKAIPEYPSGQVKVRGHSWVPAGGWTE